MWARTCSILRRATSSASRGILSADAAATAWQASGLCVRIRGVGVNTDGGFAEYIAVPYTNIWKHKPDIDLDVAAIFDPFGNAVHTALEFEVFGEDVLITGAGPIGIMAAAVAKHAGRSQHRDHRHQSISIRVGRKDGARNPRDRCQQDVDQDVQKELG
jgi:threonine 3-dehydrogenase